MQHIFSVISTLVHTFACDPCWLECWLKEKAVVCSHYPNTRAACDRHSTHGAYEQLCVWACCQWYCCFKIARGSVTGSWRKLCEQTAGRKWWHKPHCVSEASWAEATVVQSVKTIWLIKSASASSTSTSDRESDTWTHSRFFYDDRLCHQAKFWLHHYPWITRPCKEKVLTVKTC